MLPKPQSCISSGTQTPEALEELVDNHYGPEGGDATGIDASWKALFNFTSRKHSLTVAAVSILTFLAGLIVPAFAICLGELFDSFTKFGSETISGFQLLAEVYNGSLTLLKLGALGWCIYGAYFFVWVVFAELQARNARKKLFRELLKQELRWFDMREEGTGAFLSRTQK